MVNYGVGGANSTYSDLSVEGSCVCCHDVFMKDVHHKLQSSR